MHFDSLVVNQKYSNSPTISGLLAKTENSFDEQEAPTVGLGGTGLTLLHGPFPWLVGQMGLGEGWTIVVVPWHGPLVEHLGFGVGVVQLGVGMGLVVHLMQLVLGP